MMKRLLLTTLLLASGAAHAQLYSKFGPVTGVLKGSVSTPQTSAAASTDIIGLWSGCSGTNFLRGDGTCATPAGTGVTSVAQTVPAGFAIAGSPITTTGTLAISYATGQTANRVLATPDGTTGALALRALVAGDVPPINLGSTANGGVSSATILLGTNGGTSNGFFSVTGPATALRTFTFPNASATVLTSNAAVTVPQGGTGLATIPAHGVLLGEGTANIGNVTAMSLDTLLQGQGASADPAAISINNCGSSTTALSYSTSTHTFGCQTISVGGTGTVTNVATGAGLTGGPITTTGTLSVDQSSSLTWTGTETFSTNQTIFSTAASSFNPFTMCANGLATLNRCWSFRIGGGADLILAAADNSGTPGTGIVLDAVRSGAAITSIIVGNSTDNPTISVPGGIIVSGARPTINSANSSISIGATTGGTAQLWMVNSTGATDGKMWDIDANAASLTFRTVNDANNAAVTWLTVARTGTTVNSLSFAGDVGGMSYNGIQIMGTGTFTGTLTGFTANPTGTFTWINSARVACLYTTTDITATSNANTMTLTGLPTSIRPSNNRVVAAGNMQDNGVGNQITGQATVAASGTVTLAALNTSARTSSSNWTASGTKGLNAGWQICYSVD